MLQKNDNYGVLRKGIKPQKVVSVPISLFQSRKGRYFVGQTELLCVGEGASAWAALVNPDNSGVNLYANVVTISNFSDEYLTSEVWLNTDLSEGSSVSNKISPTNTALKYLPKNRVDIRFIDSSTIVPKEGINVYQRIVAPNTTLVIEEDGKFIEGPGGNYGVIIRSSSTNISKIIVACGWWEKLRG